MFSAYTWSDYFKIIAVAAVLYYLFIAVMYYPKELRALFSRRPAKPIDNGLQEEEVIDGYSGYAEDEEGNENTFADSQQLMNAVNELMSRAAVQQYTRSDLKLELKEVFDQFPTLNDPVLRTAINEYVVKQSEEKGAILLREDEVDLLWDEAE